MLNQQKAESDTHNNVEGSRGVGKQKVGLWCRKGDIREQDLYVCLLTETLDKSERTEIWSAAPKDLQ